MTPALRTWLLAVGSNVEPESSLARGIGLLRARFDVECVSAGFDVPAVGRPDQPDFVNLAVRLRSDLPLRALRAVCRHLEACCGRRRSVDRLAPRTLDLDVVAGSDGVVETAVARIPSPELLEEPHVLVPAAEVWPDYVHPASGRTLSELAAERVPPGWPGRRRPGAPPGSR